VRNWKNYNESLVRRGEILLDFDVIDNWNTELIEMNKNKEGRKFVSRFIYQVIRIHENILSFALSTN
jgi:hypothetical protein